MHRVRLVGWGLVLAIAVPSLRGQPPKPSLLPPINPAQARLEQTLGGLDGPCHAIAVSDAAELILVAGERGTLLAWPRTTWVGVRAGEKAPDVTKDHDGLITALAWTSGSLLASAGADRQIHLWSMPARERKQSLQTGELVRALAISPDGKRLAAGDDSGTIHLFDLPDGKPAGKCTGHSDWLLALAYSPDGTRLVSGGYDGQAIVWEAATGKKLLECQIRPAPMANMPPPAASPVTALAFRADNKMIAVGNSAGQIALVNPADGKPIRTLPGHASTVTGLAFHPAGTVLASSSKDRTIKLWNPDNAQMFMSLEGHAAWVQGIAFLEKGSRLASVSADQTVRIWDLSPKK